MASKKTGSKRPVPARPMDKKAMKRVKGGGGIALDMTNNKATTGQKAADKTDSYIRS